MQSTTRPIILLLVASFYYGFSEAFIVIDKRNPHPGCNQFQNPIGLLSSFPLISSELSPSSRYMISNGPLGSTDDDNRSIGIGIDLGTTFSAVAYLDDSENSNGGNNKCNPTIIPIPKNGRTMPSVVALLARDEMEGDSTNEFKQYYKALVGKEACEYEVQRQERDNIVTNVYRNVKRIIGTGGKLAASDIAEVVPHLIVNPSGKTYKKESLLNALHDAEHHPTLLQYRTDKSTKNEASTNSEKIRPELISSFILSHLKQVAEDHTQCKVSRAVIGIPAYFNDAQRQATETAAKMAGIEKVKLLREPEAAALAYGVGVQQQSTLENNQDDDSEELVLVFDLGGGTFDVSMLLIGGGLTEIISTSGNTQLGGSVFDAKIASGCFLKAIRNENIKRQSDSISKWPEAATNAVVRSAEQVRIYLSNNRNVNLALPLDPQSWVDIQDDRSIILPRNYFEQNNFTSNSMENDSSYNNATHIIFKWSRREMERLCKDEFQALLRPIREVAIMSGALLPGDSSPVIVEAALLAEEEEQALAARQVAYENFYGDDDEENDDMKDDNNSDNDVSQSYEADKILQELQEMDMKAAKKAQQRGRKRSRDVKKKERKFREEKRKLEEATVKRKANTKTAVSESSGSKNVKVQDGIVGKPISRVVLVGGATRMPGVGRLLAALTGVIPQKTVNPDEAVALGCAVHVGVLDGKEGMGTVLNPMQAAILRAVALQQQKEGRFSGLEASMSNDDFNEEEFDSVEYF